MSKLYKEYILLKLQNSEKFYLFKSGIFYIFIDNDAQVMSKILNLKLTNLNPLIQKCGFPVSSSEKYFNILKNTEYKIEIVVSNTCTSTNLKNYIREQKYESIINELIKKNIEELSISQAFEYLKYLQSKFKEIKSLNKE